MKRTASRQASLTRRLLLWVLAALFLVWGSFIVVGYRTGIHEAAELTDGNLVGTAALMINLNLPPFIETAHETDRRPVPH